MLKKAKNYIPLFLLTAAFVSSCQNYKATTTSANIKLPETFTGNADTATIARIPIHNFFADSNLVRLIDTALNANPDILTAMQRVEMARAGVRGAAAKLLPQVNITGNAGVEKYGDYTQNGVGNYDTNFSPNINSKQRIPDPVPNYFLGFQSSWEVDLWGKLSNNKKAAYLRFLASQSGRRLVTTSLAAQIAQNYYQLLALDSERSIIRKNIVLQERALEIVKIQKQGGRATELAVQQFQAQLLRTKALEFSVKQQLKEAENELNFLTGNFGKTIARDTSIIEAKLPAVLNAGIPSQLLLNRPDIQAAELELAAANADIKAARASFLPSLTLTPYVGYNAFKASLLFDPGSITWGILGGLTAPVLNRKALKAELEQRIAESKVAVFNYQKNILAGYREVSNQLNGIENYNQYYKLKQTELQSLNNALSVANDLYLVGRANYLEIITAQQSVLDAELELAQTKKNIFVSAVNLYQAVGGGWK